MKLRQITYILGLFLVMASCQKEVIRPNYEQPFCGTHDEMFDNEQSEDNTKEKSRITAKGVAFDENGNDDDETGNGNDGGDGTTGSSNPDADSNEGGITDPNNDEDSSKKRRQQ